MAILRKTITIVTLNKIEEYLRKQKEPVTKRKLWQDTGVNYDSLLFALKHIDKSLLRKVK